MSAEVSKLMDNIVIRIEGLTALTAIAGKTAFNHLEKGYSEEALHALSHPTRRFKLLLTGDRGPGLQLQRQIAEGLPVQQTFDLVVAYKQGNSPYTLTKIIAEDVDSIAHELMRTDSDKYDQANTGLWRRTVEGYSADFDDESGGTALVAIPVVCDYLPDHS